ncbi:MAG: DUF268 domain-containing protein [Chloroflexota bacterium]|nr:DUF268 domain-containing protein [Chloroflexota bacterium]
MAERHDAVKVRIREVERKLLQLLGAPSNRGVEYDFARRQVVGQRSHVLDIGGCESILPIELAKRGHQVTVLDYRPYTERHPNIRSIQGDFLINDLPTKSFDYVVFLSTIEHIGFGSYGAPTIADGDFQAMTQARKLIKDTGKIVVTVPFLFEERVMPGFERWYDIARIRRLFDGLHILAEEYYMPHTRVLGRAIQWLPSSFADVEAAVDVSEKYGCACSACYSISPSARQTLGT